MATTSSLREASIGRHEFEEAVFVLEMQLLDAREEVEQQRRQIAQLFDILNRVHARLFNEPRATTH